MKIWILQTGEPLHVDEQNLRPMRAMNLSNELAKRGHEITLISSDFDHFSKRHRERHSENIIVSDKLKIILIPSRGYKNHVGLSRLYDHAQLAFRLRNISRNLDLPEIVFIGYPPIETAWVLSKILKRHKIPFFLDVKDAWPDIFLTRFKGILLLIAKILLIPYFRMSKSVFKNSTALVAPSIHFHDWALKKAHRPKNDFDCVIPLSSPPPLIDEQQKLKARLFWKEFGVIDNEKLRIFFVGSLTDSFNFDPLISVAQNNDIQVVIAGKGPHLNRLIKSAKNIQNLIIPGWINEAQLHELALISHFSVIPLVNRFDFNMHITNKFIDSLRLGKPILTSNVALYENQINSYGIGALFDSVNLYEVITKILHKPNVYEDMILNAKHLYVDQFDFYKNYSKLISNLEKASLRLS